MRVIFATWVNAGYQGEALNEEGVKDRLVSFYEVASMKPDVIPQYVKHGYLPKPKKRRKK